jgi:hypothetical protein
MDFILELLRNLAIGAAVGTFVALTIKTKTYIKKIKKENLEKKEVEENKYQEPTFIEKMLEN